jgi:hypothetical protein
MLRDALVQLAVSWSVKGEFFQLSGFAAFNGHRFGPERPTQAAPDRATRKIR